VPSSETGVEVGDLTGSWSPLAESALNTKHTHLSNRCRLNFRLAAILVSAGSDIFSQRSADQVCIHTAVPLIKKFTSCKFRMLLS
jgi:hypothetical protein